MHYERVREITGVVEVRTNVSVEEGEKVRKTGIYLLANTYVDISIAKLTAPSIIPFGEKGDDITSRFGILCEHFDEGKVYREALKANKRHLKGVPQRGGRGRLDAGSAQINE